MEPYAKNLPIAELISQLDAYMVELGYTPSTLRHHRQACRPDRVCLPTGGYAAEVVAGGMRRKLSLL